MLDRILRAGLMLPLLIGLCNCSRVEALFKPKAPEKDSYGYDLNLRLTPRAEAKLKSTKDTIVAAAWYYGDALPAYRDKADKLNRIRLGEEHWGYSPDTRHIHMKGSVIDTARFSQIQSAEPQVLVTIYTTQPAGNPDELLSCHNFIGPVKLAQASPPLIDCDLDSADYLGDAMPQ